MHLKFKVAKGASILLKGQIIKSGSVVEIDKEILTVDGRKLPAMNRQKIEEHVRSGFLVPVPGSDRPTFADGDLLVDKLPGVNPIPTKSSDAELAQVHTDGPIRIEPAPVRQVNTLWNLDPDTLAGKGVDELNVMILERDPSIQPFDTPEEASAWLSQKFGNDGTQTVTVSTTGGAEREEGSQVATA